MRYQASQARAQASAGVGQLPRGSHFTHCLVLVPRCLIPALHTDTGGRKENHFECQSDHGFSEAKNTSLNTRYKAQQRPSQNGLKTVPKDASCELEIAAQEAKTRERLEETGAGQSSLCSHS